MPVDEGVLNSVIDGDIGSVLGWGFPIYTGGALSYIDFVGMKEFVADCDDFKEKYGQRWDVPASLHALAAAGKSIQDFGKLNGKFTAPQIKKMREADLVAYANEIGITASVDDLKADTLQKVLTQLGYN